jgi:hypothetical protein
MNFVIDRAKWRCGQDGDSRRGRGDTMLLNSDGFMDVLGMVAAQVGVPSEAMLDAAGPEGCDDRDRQRLLRGVLLTHNGTSSDLTMQAMCINDDAMLDTTVRESRLTDLFSNHGHSISFTGEYVTP